MVKPFSHGQVMTAAHMNALADVTNTLAGNYTHNLSDMIAWCEENLGYNPWGPHFKTSADEVLFHLAGFRKVSK